MRNTLLIFCFRAFYRYPMVWPTAGLVFMKFGNLDTYTKWNIQVPAFCWMPYSNFSGTSQSKFAIVQLYYVKTSFSQKQPMFYPLAGTSICKQKTLTMLFCPSSICNSCQKHPLAALFDNFLQIFNDLTSHVRWPISVTAKPKCHSKTRKPRQNQKVKAKMKKQRQNKTATAK